MNNPNTKQKAMRIYISLPITNDPKAREKADLMAQFLSKQGHTPVNPFNIYAGNKPTYEDHICYDLLAMLSCDAVLFCKGWEKSCGCNIEHDAVTHFKQFGKKDFKIAYEQ